MLYIPHHDPSTVYHLFSLPSCIFIISLAPSSCHSPALAQVAPSALGPAALALISRSLLLTPAGRPCHWSTNGSSSIQPVAPSLLELNNRSFLVNWSLLPHLATRSFLFHKQSRLPLVPSRSFYISPIAPSSAGCSFLIHSISRSFLLGRLVLSSFNGLVAPSFLTLSIAASSCR